MWTVNIINVYQKRGTCSASKRRYTRVLAPGSYKGEGARVARSYPFFSEKNGFFTMKILLAPPNAALDVEIGLHCR